MGRHVHFKADGRIVVKNAAAAFAEHHFSAVAEVLKKLWTKQDLTRRATAFSDFSHRRAAVPFLPNAFVGGIRWLSQSSHQLQAFSSQLIQLLLIHGCSLARLCLLRIHLLLLFFQSGFGL